MRFIICMKVCIICIFAATIAFINDCDVDVKVSV
jgi:hypothetical protein